MRDAFGGAFMIRLFLIFILVYIIFTALALNYAKAFKVKDAVITYLEDNSVTDLRTMSAELETSLVNFIERDIVNGYNYKHSLETCPAPVDERHATKCFKDIGVVIEQMNPNAIERNKLGVYYKVTTYFGFNIGFFRLFGAANGSVNNTPTLGTWAISGESKTIVGDGLVK